MKFNRTHRLLLALALLLAPVGFVGCSASDGPSEPQQTPAVPPGGGQGVAFNITVTATPDQLEAGGSTPATIRVKVRRVDNGQPPANGTTVGLSTTLGDLQTPGSGIQNILLSLLNGDAQILLYPGRNLGGALIRAQLQNSFGQINLPIGEVATFFLSFVTPNTGAQQGGEVVEVTGGGIEEPVRVTFDGTPAEVLSVTSDRIRVRTPPSITQVATGTTRPVTVQATVRLNSADQATDALANGFVYLPGNTPPGGVQQPQVFSVTPASGPNEGGTEVTLQGVGFQSPVQVFFGTGTTPNNFTGVEATVLSVTSSQLVVRTPSASGIGQANNNSAVNILVRNLGTGFAGVTTSAFTYGSRVIITSVAPNQIPYNSRSLVTVFGQGFSAPVAVSLAGLAATVISVTGTEIVVRASIPNIEGCTDVNGEVRVVNINNGDFNTFDDFTYHAFMPTIFGVTPPSGPGAIPSARTVNGANFEEPVRVVFGDAAAGVNATSVSSISVTTPVFTAFDEESCDDDGDGTQGMRFVNTSVDVTVTNLLTECEDMVTGGYSYSPSDISCRGDAGPPPPPALPECSDGIDNDGDGLVDHETINPINPDPECAGPNDNDESA